MARRSGSRQVAGRSVSSLPITWNNTNSAFPFHQRLPEVSAVNGVETGQICPVVNSRDLLLWPESSETLGVHDEHTRRRQLHPATGNLPWYGSSCCTPDVQLE